MIAVIEVEVRRLWARPLCRAVAIALFVGLVAAPPLIDWAFRERARIERDADVERCVQAKPPKVRDGVTMPTISDDIGAPEERATRCERAIPRRDGTFHLREIGEVLRPIGALIIVGAFMIGSTAMGADWNVGIMPTLLTWEGRRRRVVAAKLIAAVLTVFLAVVVWEGLLTLVVSLFAAAREATDGTGHSWLAATAGLILRTAAAAVGSAAIGLSLALIGRGTAAALAGGLGYVVVVESVVGANFAPLRPWLMLDNVIVFVKGQFEGGPGGDVPGRTVTAAALVLLGYVVAAVLAGAATFTRRDVT